MRWASMLSAVVRKELRQTVRDRRMMFLLIGAPIIQLVVFGFAVNLDIDHVPTVVVRGTAGEHALDPRFRADQPWPEESKRALIGRGYRLADEALAQAEL